jgi:hypothetical protein
MLLWPTVETCAVWSRFAIVEKHARAQDLLRLFGKGI